MSGRPNTDRIPRWYFGGIASASAACCTHPLDLLKVHLQTQQHGHVRANKMIVRIFRSDGILGFYNGLSASLMRQLTHSMTRFALYEIAKQKVTENGEPLTFFKKIVLAGASGAIGGIAGTPADVINVRMQNDIKLAEEERRGYKHALDGLYRVYREEGVVRMFSGVSMASSRAVMVTIGQLACYDQIKSVLLKIPFFTDNLVTHFSSSICAGVIATFLTQPLDVMKTRMMNATPGTYSSIFACALDIAKTGPLGFLKGFTPAFLRLGPQTIITFIILEQFRLRYGYFRDTAVQNTL